MNEENNFAILLKFLQSPEWKKNPLCFLFLLLVTESVANGWLAQLVRAPALQAGGRRFESLITHHFLDIRWNLHFTWGFFWEIRTLRVDSKWDSLTSPPHHPPFLHTITKSSFFSGDFFEGFSPLGSNYSICLWACLPSPTIEVFNWLLYSAFCYRGAFFRFVHY